MIYAIAEIDDPTVVKIGYTKTRNEEVNLVAAWRRLCHLQTANWRRLSCVAVAPGGLDRESVLHCAFMDQRKIGEWFLHQGLVKAWVLAHQLDIALRTDATFSREDKREHRKFRRTARQVVSKTSAEKQREEAETNAWILASVGR